MMKLISWLFDKLEQLERDVQKTPGAVQPNEHSLPYFDFIKKGKGKRPPKGFSNKVRFYTIMYPRILRSFTGIFKSILSLKKNPENPLITANENFIAQMEAYLKEQGVSLMGYTKIEPQYIFDHTAISYENAIILAQEMDGEKIKKAPSLDTDLMVQKVYADLGDIANNLASYLRKNGYSAHASAALRGTAVFPILAQKANIGVVGRNGLLLNQKYGPRMRLAAVFTSIDNLPFANPDENPHQWIRDYCDLCGVCIKKCPPKALYEKEIKRPGGITHVDNTKCFPYFHKNHGCAVCIKVCPFSEPDFRVNKEATEKLILERKKNN